MVLLSGCYALVNTYLVTYANGQGVGSEISLFFSVYAGFLFLTRPLSGKLADRFGYIIIAPMLGLFAATFLIISVATSLCMFLFAAVLFAFGYGGCQSVINSMAMKLVPQSRRGAGSATNFLGSDLGNIIGPLVGGTIAQNISNQAMWQLTIILMILGIIVVLACNRTINERVALAAEQA
ncbi:MAG: MFS transporter [Atopobiaceae bacterium]